MKKLKAKQKAWLIKKSHLAMRKLTKQKKRHGSSGVHVSVSKPQNFQSHKFIAEAPEKLSLINNTSETLNYFSEILKIVQECRLRDKIYFDLSKIKEITADAIMYIIALISNVKRTRALHVEIEGNFPINEKAREVIENVGFYKYVRTNSPIFKPQVDGNIQISSGIKAEGKLAGLICDFVKRKCDNRTCNTKRLYPLIIELMTNTNQHAYIDTGSVMNCNWYIFAEDTQEHIHFVFLDTGSGIPETVRKKFAEKVRELFLVKDASYIVSALKGEFRTETRQSHRGKGLPEIYNDVKAGAIEDFLIISDQGICKVSRDGDFKTQDNEDAFRGTLFSWNYRKCC